MSLEVEGDIVVSDGDHKIDVTEQEVPLIRHMIRRLRGQLEWLPRGQGKSRARAKSAVPCLTCGYGGQRPGWGP
jgi:hypothetical protein